ncbi:hypothetical protein MLD38_038518 [Melastoma candidum]|uniref:Uncharacterized protein n=2 Tax=Melastoma candidum TaxID=119954 RepID=A0ACB9KZ62_9MYRT|nr:hypothetical protein MLD38_038517 [Melastoma candidum]KAI4302817.1 hypothetical protein MLD38_038518 [Melastoma candidum]
MAERHHPQNSRCLKLTKDQDDEPLEDITPGELHKPIQVPNLNTRGCHECGQPLPEEYQPPANEDWTTGICGCVDDPEILQGVICSSEKLSNSVYSCLKIIREWNSELQERTGKFWKQANAVAEWDKRILHNRDVLLGLEIEAAKVAETDSYLELQLELIETHQQEVDMALQSIEDDTERTFKDERGFLVDDDAASTRDAI